MAEKRTYETMSRDEISEAAELNRRVMKRLDKAFASDPEVDLLALIPSSYSERLAKRKKFTADSSDVTLPKVGSKKQDGNKLPAPPEDLRYRLSPDEVTIVEPLADSVRDFIKNEAASEPETETVETETRFFTALVKLIQDAEVLSLGLTPLSRTVVKLGADTVAKLMWREQDFNEYDTLQYLMEHRPSIPVPRPLGLIHMGRVSILLSSYLPGVTLEEAWSQLTVDQKGSVREQLDTIFRDLRAMHLPSRKLLGGVAGGGCKDQRRHLRRGTGPIASVEDFKAFQFSNPKYGSTTFIDFLRAFTPDTSSYKVVFTHGDLRPANIIVKITEDRKCTVVGIIDWEDGGFYPEYYEATKMTNCLATNENWDWYGFLPSCISPHSYRTEWLLDYAWGRHLE